MAPTSKIFIAFTGRHTAPLGTVWSISERSSGFYLESFFRRRSVAHASLHGPTDEKPNHRFHLKVDDRLANQQTNSGKAFVFFDVPEDGYKFHGRRVARNAYLVARIRWTWELDRDKFRHHAYCGQVPKPQEHHSAAKLSWALGPNMACDIDVVVSYDEPYWPDAKRSERQNARLGPLTDGKSLYLTATSYERLQRDYPAPSELTPPLPKPDETPNRITCCGVDESGFYWFVETITSRELLVRTMQDRQ